MQTRESDLAEWPGPDSEPAQSGGTLILSRFLARARGAWRDVPSSIESIGMWLRYVVTAITVVAFGYLCARFVWLAVVGVTPPIDERVMDSSLPAFSSARATPSYVIFSTFDPFFRRSVTAEPSRVTAAPETNLDLKLFGLRVGREAGGGSAIIRTPDKRQASYAIGDEVTPDVVLKEVLANRAIISRNGVEESLSLRPEGDAGSSFIQRSDDARTSSGSTLSLSSSSLSSADLFSKLNLRPRLQGGSVNGFYIDPEGANSELLKSAGLRPADILLSVNDVRLVSVERITDVLEEIENQVSFGAVIERDGAPITITLERPAS